MTMTLAEEDFFARQKEIVELAQSRDEAALAVLYDTHVNQVYRYCLARLGHVHDAEDVTCEIFIKMLGGLETYEWRKVPFAAWLMRIARNEVVNFLRHSSKRKHDMEIPEELVDLHASDPQDMVCQELEVKAMLRAVACLPDSEREVITLRYLSGLPIQETALALCKSETNVKKTQHTALHHLRLMLTQPAVSNRKAVNNLQPSRELTMLEVVQVIEKIKTQIPGDLGQLSLADGLARIGYNVRIFNSGSAAARKNLVKKRELKTRGISRAEFLSLKAAKTLEDKGYKISVIGAIWKQLPETYFEDLLGGTGTNT